MDAYTPLPKRIAETISNMIFIEKKYLPGHKLPNERCLAAELNVSRNSLREALKLLVADNILEIKRSSGVFVSEHPGISTDPLGLNFIADKSDLLNKWLEVRLLLEPHSARFVAQRATDEELEHIVSLADLCYQKIHEEDSISEGIYFDTKFHEAIANATHNEIISKITPILSNSFHDSVLIASAKDYTEELKKNMEFHVEIAKLLQMRDEDGAELSMRVHLMNAFHFYKNR